MRGPSPAKPDAHANRAKMATKLLSRIIESSPRTMTAARQERKPPKLPRLLVVMALAAGIFTPLVLRAATDISSGLFHGKALFGRPEIELNMDGAVWRFTNEGNRG